MRIMIISDLHIAAGPLDDYDPAIEAAAVRFWEDIMASELQTELVINGDFLDFVQATPWKSPDLESQTADGVPLCFSEEQSMNKLDAIFTAHPSTFEALRRLLLSPSLVRLSIIPGNHDVDIFWPGVRERLAEHLTRGNADAIRRLSFCLDEPYRPPEFPALWIEHGHQRDPCNRFEVRMVPRWSPAAPPIFLDVNGVPRLLECAGTRFMLKFLNALDEKYPFVDNVKPFSKFVRMFLVSSFAPGFGPLKAVVSYWALFSFIAGRLSKAPTDLLSTDQIPEQITKTAASEMKRAVTRLSETAISRFATKLRQEGFDLNQPLPFFLRSDNSNVVRLLVFLSDNPDILDVIEEDNAGLMSPDDEGYLTFARGFLADETACLREAAAGIIRSGTAAGVVMGHTHEPISQPELNYINTGCWTRYLREEPTIRSTRSWSLLKGSAYKHFPYELAYAESTSDSKYTLARLVFET